MGLIFRQDGDGFFKSHATRPIPFPLEDGNLRLYFSSRNADDIPYPTYIDVRASNPSEVLYVNREPLLDIGRVGTFDDSGITPVSILRRQDGCSLMYYVGWKRRRYNVTIETAIGVAELSNCGTSLTRMFEGPILGQDKNHPILVAAPYVVASQDKYLMWYCSGSRWEKTATGYEMIYSIQYAESEDAISWIPKTDRAILAAKFDHEVISAPWVVNTSNGIYMWYCWRGIDSSFDKRFSPGVAISHDGITWQRRDAEVGISLSNDGWDSEMVCYPSVCNLAGKTFMFYSGNDVGKGGMGYAVAEDSLNILPFHNV